VEPLRTQDGVAAPLLPFVDPGVGFGETAPQVEPGRIRNHLRGKHGRFSAEAIARRREVNDLLRAARELLDEGM
jgi:hypothetical protein